MRRPAIILIATAALLLFVTTACGDNKAVSTQSQQYAAIPSSSATSTLRPDIQPDEATAMAKARSVSPTEIMARKETGIAGHNLTAIALTTGPTPTEESFPSGILSPDGPYIQSPAYEVNHWRGQINGYWVQVFVGGFRDSSEGFVSVESVGIQAKGHVISGYYKTPIDAGAVKITKVEGMLITLLSNKGTTFVFDLASRTFLK